MEIKIFRVRVFTFILFMVLACLLGVYTVWERSRQTHFRYDIAKMLREEKKLDESILKAQLEYSRLISPAYLEKMNTDLYLNFKPLNTGADCR